MLFILEQEYPPWLWANDDAEPKKRKEGNRFLSAIGYFTKGICLAILAAVVAAVVSVSSVLLIQRGMDEREVPHGKEDLVSTAGSDTIELPTRTEAVVAEMNGDLVTMPDDGLDSADNPDASADKDSDDRPMVVYQIISTRGRTVIMAKVNTRFCKVAEDGKSLSYAPVVLPPKLGTPSDEDYLNAGWLYNSVEPPDTPEGKMVSEVSYYADGNEVFAEYTFEDAPPPIRTFSKLKLYGALVQAGLWDSLVGWLQNQTVNGMNAYTAFTLAQDLSDAHPLFQSWYAKIKADLEISDEIAEAILEASLAE